MLIILNIQSASAATLFSDNFDDGAGCSALTPWTAAGVGAADTSAQTSNSGNCSMFTSEAAVTATSPIVNTADQSVTITAWVREGDNSFSNAAEASDDMVLEYLNSSLIWTQVQLFDGAGVNGRIINVNQSLPGDAAHSGFRIRFRQIAGSGSTLDFWHIDDVVIDGVSNGPTFTCPLVPLTNASFENYNPASAVVVFGVAPTRSFQFPETTVPGWDTDAPDGLIEIWESGHNGGDPAPTPSFDGGTHAEIHANQTAALTYDIPAVAGDTVEWSVWHRGRRGVDTATVSIGSPGGSFTVLENLATDNTLWQNYSGSFVVATGQTRFEFRGVSTSNGDTTAGNFIDDFQIGVCPSIRDYSDAPVSGTSYGETFHTLNAAIQLGAAIDADTPPIANANASGDGSDDDGVSVFPALTVGEAAYTLPAANITALGTGNLYAWIDFDGDGAFSVEEFASTSVTNGTLAGPLTFGGFGTIMGAGTTFARIRFTTDTLTAADSAVPANDGEVEDYQVNVVTFPSLIGDKVVSVWDPLNQGLYALPGNDVTYSITITNDGNVATDTDSMILVDKLPPEIEFFNGDLDEGGPEVNPVSFSQTGGAGLTFTYGTDVKFGSGTTAPADFASCTTISPDGTYRPDLTFICFNPKGTMAAGDPDPTFTVSFRARIK